jgi:hypothetical protein
MAGCEGSGASGTNPGKDTERHGLGISVAEGNDLGLDPSAVAICEVDAISNHGMTIQPVDLYDETGDASDTPLYPKWCERPQGTGCEIRS